MSAEKTVDETVDKAVSNVSAPTTDEKNIKEACCKGKEDCINDIKDADKRPNLSNIKELITSIQNTKTNEGAKEKLIKSGVCNFWCQILWGLLSSVAWIIAGEGNSFVVNYAIQIFITYVLVALLSLWWLRCCIRLDDKCWFTVLVVFYAIGTANAAWGALNTFQWFSYHFLYIVAFAASIVVAIGEGLLCAYGICYLKTWPGENGSV